MKKFYLFAASILFAASASAQVASANKFNVKPEVAGSAPFQIISNEYVPSASKNVDKFGPITYFIDYAAYNIEDGIMPSGETATGGRSPIDVNAAPEDSMITSISVVLNPYTGFTDYNSIVNSLVFVNAADPGATVTVDSLFFQFGHANESGDTNRIHILLRTGTNVSFGTIPGNFTAPNGTIYWRDSIVTTSTLSPNGVSAFGDNSTVDYKAGINHTQPLANGHLTFHIIPDVNVANGDTFGVSAFRYASQNSEPVLWNSLGTKSESPNSIFIFYASWNIWSQVTFSSLASAENLNANGFTLHSFMPNPANAETTVSFELANNSDVRFDVIDMNGRLVKSVDLGNQVAGKTNYVLNTSDLATGIYNVVMRANNSVFTKKLSVVR